MVRNDSQILSEINTKNLFVRGLEADVSAILTHDAVVTLGGIVSNFSEKNM